MLSRFDTVPDRDGRTDGQNCYIDIALLCWRAIKMDLWDWDILAAYLLKATGAVGVMAAHTTAWSTQLK